MSVTNDNFLFDRFADFSNLSVIKKFRGEGGITGLFLPNSCCVYFMIIFCLPTCEEMTVGFRVLKKKKLSGYADLHLEMPRLWCLIEIFSCFFIFYYLVKLQFTISFTFLYAMIFFLVVPFEKTFYGNFKKVWPCCFSGRSYKHKAINEGKVLVVRHAPNDDR